MSDDWTEVDTFTDASGKRITVGHAGSLTRVAVLSPAGVVLAAIVLDGETREQFDEAYAAASWQAGADARSALWQAEAVRDGE